jgi:YLP motif-containing protein 1
LDLRSLLLPPARPKRLLLLLRGLPGSGKSHIARAVRVLELDKGNAAPRTHSIDDYFMVDVEREEGAADSSAAANSSRRPVSAGSKRRNVVIEQEYQHDAAMEGSYWKSLIRALGRTLSGGEHALVLLDAPAPKADQLREAWMLGQGAGYEVAVVQPLTSDLEVGAGVA